MLKWKGWGESLIRLQPVCIHPLERKGKKKYKTIIVSCAPLAKTGLAWTSLSRTRGPTFWDSTLGKPTARCHYDGRGKV